MKKRQKQKFYKAVAERINNGELSKLPTKLEKAVNDAVDSTFISLHNTWRLWFWSADCNISGTEALTEEYKNLFDRVKAAVQEKTGIDMQQWE